MLLLNIQPICSSKQLGRISALPLTHLRSWPNYLNCRDLSLLVCEMRPTCLLFRGVLIKVEKIETCPNKSEQFKEYSTKKE